MTEMSKSERTELGKVVRLRMKVATAAVNKLAAERRAQVEAGLATVYRKDAKEWRDITAKAEVAVQEAKVQVDQICEERGIPRDFRPGLRLSWWGRGENAIRERRDELRKAALQQIDADKRAALMTVEAWGCERLEELHAGSLESGEAKEFLTSLPGPEHLLPEVEIPRALSPWAGEGEAGGAS